MRKLSWRLLEALGVWSLNESPESPVCFDYLINGELWNTKVRHGKGDMPWKTAGKPLRFWNEDSAALAKEFRRLIITEGEFDAAACSQAGAQCVVSVPNGATMSGGSGGKTFGYLYAHGDALWPWLARFEEIVLAVDADAPGMALRDSLAIRLGDHRCRWAVWPDGCKDANDVLMKHDANTLRNCVLDAKRMWTDEVYSPNERPTEDEPDGVTTGIAGLDPYIRLKPPELAVLVGPYGSGKSIFLRQLLYSLWTTHGWPFLLTVFEEPDSRYRREFRRLILKTAPTEWSEEDKVRADFEYDRFCTLLARPKAKQSDAVWLLDRIEYAIKTYGPKVVAVDPVNQIDHEMGQSERNYWSRFLSACKGLADDYKVVFIICGHPTADAMRHMHPRRAILPTDMDGGAMWSNKADRFLSAWRFNWTGQTMLRMGKAKDHETMGKLGLIELIHDPLANGFRVARTGDRLLDVLADELEGDKPKKQQRRFTYE